MTLAGERRIGDQRKRVKKRPIDKLPDRYQQLLDGSINPEDLTLTELTNGLRTPTGRFKRIVQPALRNALVRELHLRMSERFQGSAFDAIDTVLEVMDVGEGASAYQGQKDGTGRLKAAQYVIERVIGKIPDKVEINQQTTVWEGMQADGSGLFIDIEVEDIPDENPRRRSPRARTKQRREEVNGEAAE